MLNQYQIKFRRSEKWGEAGVGKGPQMKSQAEAAGGRQFPARDPKSRASIVRRGESCRGILLSASFIFSYPLRTPLDALSRALCDATPPPRRACDRFGDGVGTKGMLTRHPPLCWQRCQTVQIRMAPLSRSPPPYRSRTLFSPVGVST